VPTGVRAHPPPGSPPLHRRWAPALAIPIKANPQMANIMEYYIPQQARRALRHLPDYHSPPPAALWSFSPCESSVEWQLGSTLSTWLKQAFITLGATPLAGFMLTSHNLCKGDASICR
jgi:hypothetical protein